MTVWVAMPAYNEAPRLPALLDRWVSVLAALDVPHRYVIVDDGSRDDTPNLLADFARNHPAEIITHPTNLGLGAGLRDALKHVAENADPQDIVVMMDADNTQPPELLPEMLELLDDEVCDVVIASRFRQGASVSGLSALRRFTSFGARALFQFTFPIRGVRDYTCGYRAYRVEIIQDAFDLYGPRFCDRPGFECTADILLRLAKLGARCREVPMELRYEAKAADSNMQIGRTIRKTLSLMLTRRLERTPNPPN